MPLPTTAICEWSRDNLLISTDRSLVNLQALNAAFDSDQLSWAKGLPDEELNTMVDRSVNFGLYITTPKTQLQSQSSSINGTPGPIQQSRSMIGFARIVSDCVTMAYLTDVYVLSEHQSRGLASWLMDCVKEWWDMMPNGRRLIFIASEGKAETFYARKLLSGRIEDESVEEGKARYRIFTASGRGKKV